MNCVMNLVRLAGIGFACYVLGAGSSLIPLAISMWPYNFSVN